MKKLAIVTTHPIQYNAPWFKLLNERGKVKPYVFYTWSQAEEGVQDKDFGKMITWDVPLTEGYDYKFVHNTSKQPGTHHRKGIINPTLINEIESIEPEAVLVFGWNFISHWKVLKYFKGRLPVYFRGDSTLLDPMPSWKKWLRKTYLSRVYEMVDIAFYVGTANREYYKWAGLKDIQLIFAPHAVDNHRFSSQHFEEEALGKRRELGYKENDLVILYAGKLIAKKGITYLIETVINLNTQGKRVHLLIVGNGELGAYVDEQCYRYDYLQRIHFQNQSQMPSIYRIGDVFCLPSMGPGETWGLAVNEAMICGLPIVVSERAGCAWDLVIEGENGFQFSYRETRGLNKCLANVVKERDRLCAMGNRSRDLIRNWNYVEVCKSIEQVMNE